MICVLRQLSKAGTFRGTAPVTCVSIFSRTMCSVPSDIPTNLHLADMTILEPPPEDIVKPIEYLFPPKDFPSTIEVRSFQNFEEKSVQVAPLDKRVFGVAIRQDIIHQIIRYQRAKIRQPQCTKGISELRGSTRKLYQQKGTGRSRVGMARVPGRRGGPKAHGPVLRDFSFSLNRKMRAMGMMIALAAKFREGNLIVFDKFELETLKTKALTQLLENHGLLTNMTLFIDNGFQDNFATASRNLYHVNTLPENRANVYDIVKHEKLAISMDALATLQERLIAQKSYLGKKKALFKNMDEYSRLGNIGASLD